VTAWRAAPYVNLTLAPLSALEISGRVEAVGALRTKLSVPSVSRRPVPALVLRAER
jgi:hypothetical protein